jgi:hypothetical protein
MVNVIQNFSSRVPRLRAYFESVYRDPRSTLRSRFCWDLWNIEGQYFHLRTPAWEYFPKKDYLVVHEQIVTWGRKNLGCWDISPPWLSLYLDGHYQNAHADKPHGPFAFVLSLCHHSRFKGGSTFVFKNTEDLTQDSAFFEKKNYMDSFTPKFNQMLVFDPSRIHGVDRVIGPHDPRDGRLVIHGWFTQPRVQITGSLGRNKKIWSALIQGYIDELGHQLSAYISEGYLCLNLKVKTTGAIHRSDITISTLNRKTERFVQQKIKTHSQSFQFPKSTKPIGLTLPIEIKPRNR